MRALSLLSLMILAAIANDAMAEIDTVAAGTSGVVTAKQISDLPTQRRDWVALLGGVATPVGPFHNNASTGGGVGAQFIHPVGGRTSLIYGAGIDFFGNKIESPAGKWGSISSEYAYAGLELSILHGGSGSEYSNSAQGGIITAVGLTNFDSKFKSSTVDAEVHFSQNAFAGDVSAFYDMPLNNRHAIRFRAGMNHAFSHTGDSRVYASLGFKLSLPIDSSATGEQHQPLQDDSIPSGTPHFSLGPSVTCNFPDWGHQSRELAHGFGIGARVVMPVELPNFLTIRTQNRMQPTGAVFGELNYGMLHPTYEYDVAGIDEKASSLSMDIGAQYNLWPTRSAVPYLQASFGYESVTSEMTSTFTQPASFDHSESGWEIRGGVGVRVPVQKNFALDFTMDTPLISLGFERHSMVDANWLNYKPQQTRLGLVLLLTPRIVKSGAE